MNHLLRPTSDPAWVLTSHGYDPLRESIVESRFSISNGFLGIKGGRSTTRGARWVVPPRTYVAGLFDTPGTDHPVPELVPAADWLRVRILLSGRPLVHHPGDVSRHHMTLDMKRGMLLSKGNHVRAPDLKVQVHTLRLVSLSERAIGLQIIAFEVESGAIDVTFEATFEGTDLGLIPERLEHDLGVWRTQNSAKRLAVVTAASLQINGRDRMPVATGRLMSAWTWTMQPGQRVWFQRLVAVARSDREGADPAAAARAKLTLALQGGGQRVVAAHEAAWAERWRGSDIVVAGDPAAQQALRFAIYQLNSAANPADERVSIGARALTGDQYHGHVFWDTEIFLLPFYTLTWPEAARSLLMYRFHTLDAARRKAAAMGWLGALYAWESADTGVEATPDQIVTPDGRVVDVLCGRQEQHISADVAYAVWQYWQATGDETFLRDAGAEIVLETGRFWASRAVLDRDGRYHIRGVIGPDEYHEHVDDNAYTNVMARWNIRRALDIATLLARHWPAHWSALANRIGLDDAERKRWRTVADGMAICIDSDTGLFEQFDGYFDLEDIPLADYAGRSVGIDMVLGRNRIQNAQIHKQADVVALLALLPEEFRPGADIANFRYYEARCSHDSSLSPAMHGLVAARLGETERAL
ncbi:MAG TPA: hypothetical protein VHO91_00035, partial [Rhodopila sp.]|nr:hypothetical protein [Rhodopila sp.]